MAEDITLDELLVAIREAGGGEDDESLGKTMRELCAIWQCSSNVAQRHLYRARAAGYLRRSSRKVERIDGSMSPVPTYWFELPKPVKARKK